MVTEQIDLNEIKSELLKRIQIENMMKISIKKLKILKILNSITRKNEMKDIIKIHIEIQLKEIQLMINNFIETIEIGINRKF